MNGGSNSASVNIDDNEILLTGLDSITTDCEKNKRSFGCGWAKYDYYCNGTHIMRKLSVKPSLNPYDGTSAFLLTVTVKNNSDTAKEYAYRERLGVNYREIQFQSYPEEYLKANCVYEPYTVGRIAAVKITTCTDEPMKPARDEMSRYEFYPSSPFMCDIKDCGKMSVSENSIEAVFSFKLDPQEKKQLQLVIGFAMSGELADIETIVNKLNCGSDYFGVEWLKILPKFDSEPDKDFKRELVWHAYCLEAMATYSEYYKETKIPQGTVYDYFGGQHASARDNFQHALPLVYYNPKLAKSVIRYMLKRTTPFGEIRLIEMGSSFAYNERYFTSDQQLYFFMLMTAYLEITKDYAFLSEKIMPYPMKNSQPMKVLEFIRECFMFLKDTIGCGEHGLIRLMNADWCDAVFYVENVPYNMAFFSGESHMNTAMALSILDRLSEELSNAAAILENERNELTVLSKGMCVYREALLEAFLHDMRERSFPKRMYFNGRSYGDNNMFLEPQGFTLQIREISNDKKAELYKEMKKRLYKGEALGARQQENPEFTGNKEWYSGSRENGGFWYSLNGPVIIGVSQFDKSEAIKLLSDMTLKNMSKKFPEYWSSYWSSADTLESSLIPEHGLPYWCIPVYCAHPHAWILYCYYKINK